MLACLLDRAYLRVQRSKASFAVSDERERFEGGSSFERPRVSAFRLGPAKRRIVGGDGGVLQNRFGFGQLRAESLRGRERTRRRVVGPLEITDEDQTGCGPCADETGDAVVTAEARRQQ